MYACYFAHFKRPVDKSNQRTLGMCLSRLGDDEVQQCAQLHMPAHQLSLTDWFLQGLSDGTKGHEQSMDVNGKSAGLL